MFLHLSVSHSVHWEGEWGLPETPCTETPLYRDPPVQRPPGQGPLDRDPLDRDPQNLTDISPGQRRILLECILVVNNFSVI